MATRESELRAELLRRELASRQAPPAPFGAGVAQLGATALTGAAAQVGAGIAGMAAGLTPGLPPGTAADVVRGVEDALTVPLGEEGQALVTQTARKIMESLPAPVADLVRGAGSVAQGIGRGHTAVADAAAEAFGPAAGAAVVAAPTALAEFTGMALGAATLRAHNRARRAALKGVTLEGGMLSNDDLLRAAKSIYQEIDNSGVVVPSRHVVEMNAKIAAAARKAGGAAYTNPALRELRAMANDPGGVTVGALVNLRQIAQDNVPLPGPGVVKRNAAIETRNAIDRALDSLTAANLVGDEPVGEMLRTARSLTRRGKRSEAIMEAIEVGRRKASGGENGIRIELEKLITRKRDKFLFNEAETKAIQDVVKGVKGANLFKALGRFGIMEGRSSQIVTAAIGGALGVGFGTITGIGAASGVSLFVGIGMVSKAMAKRLTARGAKMADEVVRAGNDGAQISQVYTRNVPIGARTPRDLATIIARPGVDFSTMPKTPLNLEAIRLATNARQRARQLILSSGAISGAAAAPAPGQAPAQ